MLTLKYNPSLSLVKSVLRYQKYKQNNSLLSLLLVKVASLNYHFWKTITGSDIHKYAKIQHDLQLPHPNGVVIHEDAIIGARCMIMQQVTIGQLADGAAPLIGNDVYIGAGAKVLGGVKIGDFARIGANAVVLIDVPSNATAVGIPAKIVTK
jgi:serine O-acetyltransferase